VFVAQNASLTDVQLDESGEIVLMRWSAVSVPVRPSSVPSSSSPCAISAGFGTVGDGDPGPIFVVCVLTSGAA